MTEKFFIDVQSINPQRMRAGGIEAAAFAAFVAQIADLGPCEKDLFSLLSVPSGDPRIKRVLDALQSVRVDIMDRSSVQPKQFYMRRAREYSAQDALSSAYAVPEHKKFLGEVVDDYAQDENGIPHLKASALKHLKRECGSVLYTRGSPIMVVRGKVKAALETSGLKGLMLVEPVYRGKKQVEECDKVWVVWSAITLPPMKNLFRDEKGGIYKYFERERTTQNLAAWEGEGLPAEFHYRTDRFSEAGNFDLALTVERFGDHAGEPCLIGSQNFFRFMIEELGEDLAGIPVHLEQDDTIPWVGPYPPPWEHLNIPPEWLKKRCQ